MKYRIYFTNDLFKNSTALLIDEFANQPLLFRKVKWVFNIQKDMYPISIYIIFCCLTNL